MLATKQQAEEELYMLTHSAQMIERLQVERTDAYRQLYQASIQLHSLREQAGDDLANHIGTQLKELGMPHAQFQVRFAPIPSQVPYELQAYSQDVYKRQVI